MSFCFFFNVVSENYSVQNSPWGRVGGRGSIANSRSITNVHRRRKVWTIGGQGLEYWGAKGGPKSQQAHNVVMTSMRRNDVASSSF